MKKSISYYSFIGSVLGTVLLASIMLSISNNKLGLGVGLAFVIGAYIGGYLAARLHSEPENRSNDEKEVISIVPIFGCPVGGIILMLIRNM